eukprot:GHVS01085967.1.p1 GENE.GHVS01085967.1~~GHVS01085967.1.p1  ORF type:complete len:100 (+),score=27.43 GHVS01085967.1:46-300(+)
MPSSTASAGAPSSTSPPNAMAEMLSGVPGWKEFVEDGTASGLDVGRILTNPSVLKDPRVKHRFIRLVDKHEAVKALFRTAGIEL